MRTTALAAASLLSAAVVMPALAQSTDPNPPIYIDGLGSYIHLDDRRDAEDGAGGRFVIGFPIDATNAFELDLLGYGYDRESDSRRDVGYGGGVNFVHTFGANAFRPLFLIGGGALREEIKGTKDTNAYANAGLGFIANLGSPRLALRGDARYVSVFNDTVIPGENRANDIHYNLGLQYELAERTPPDLDGDGVPNALDQCPNTPPGVRVDAKGCPLDSDGDGVIDAQDQCPNTPAGVSVDARGCPIDSDGDGVPDASDRCPNTPKNLRVGTDGCPLDGDGDGVPDGLDACPNTPAGLQVDPDGCVRKAQTVVLKNVNFEFDSAKLTADAKLVLNDIVKGLIEQPELKVEIAGHTDSIGSDAYNLKLSRERAASVRSYLVSQGVPGAQLSSQGYGEQRPIGDNKTEEGRAMNRRVEFIVLSK